jgi:hypothetical protein
MKQPDAPRSLLLLIPVLTLAAGSSWAQQAPPTDATTATPTPAAPATPAREVPRPDQLEPGVDTSATTPSGAAGSQPVSSNGAAPPTTRSKKSSKPGGAPQAHEGGAQPSPDANSTGTGGSPAQANAAASTAAHSKTGTGKAQDRIELDTTQITGNRELPKVLYIVPWKRSDLGDLVGKPPNSLLDEVLTPVDRDVFKRENRYYDALKPDAAAPAGGAASPAPAGAAAGPVPAAGAAPQSGGKP